MCELSIVIPVFNEEEIIPELFRRLKEAALKITEDFELIFVSKKLFFYNLNRTNQ